MSVLDHEDINNYIVEYLKAQGMSKTANCIQQEIKSIFFIIKINTSRERPRYILKDYKYQGLLH
jgi:hypothetical protein